MMGIIDLTAAKELASHLYLWDAVEKRGTPITQDIHVIDMDNLSQEQRLVISGGNPEEITKLVEDHGSTLESQLTLSIRIFAKLVNAVYEKSHPSQQQQIVELIRETLDAIDKGEKE
jgi:organic radical activating enzyme